jgi:hypothetical protein
MVEEAEAAAQQELSVAITCGFVDGDTVARYDVNESTGK